MSATSIINNSTFFRTVNSRRNSTSSVTTNSNLINGYPRNSPRNSLVTANSNGNYAPNYRVNGINGVSGINNQYGRRLSSGAALAINVRRCQSMRQSKNGLFYDADEEFYDEDVSRFNKINYQTDGLSTRRASQVDGGYHSNGSLTSSDSYSSYTKYSNKDNPLSSIRVHIYELSPYLENVIKVCLLGTHNVGKSNMIDLFKECHSEQNSPKNNSKNIFHVNLSFTEGDVSQFLDDISIRTHSDSFEEADSIISSYPADIYVVMYAVNDRDSFDEAKFILKELSKNNEAKLKFTILVANKSDLVRSRVITRQDGKQLAIDSGCKYVETSCTISHNVHLLLAGIAALINPTISKTNKNVNGIGDVLNGDTNYSKSPINENGISNQPIQPEPEKIRIWREEHQKLLKIKDENESEREKELKEQAKKELEDWYERYKQQLSKSKQTNRNAEKEFIADRNDAEGDKHENWEKISKMCDFSNSKATRNLKDTSRLRTILLQLKQTQN